ncbi:hypothetical protein DCO58_03190 [Helicobacter saguini]|uniref:Uncharacterized protein n=1 Tax=Helicobacter saguini TaxID=1548018 RepID=A0A347VS74_9HELI|nr:hypothetical protein [Helicobacter saguini]MWV62625.1 hypothetical protein [Helicobacter saguini]MWV66703.1 hypothetical protein [Helicobacter saguini]MWV69053.1 hypothetical protein [Helicobacter saguini]MWV71393.1 hypothetical protein [Helicobacter saguini]TLD94023.1 hypothetical protein LS64_007655 [Helicobacter saguini]
MNNVALKDLQNALHKDLKILPKGSNFIVKENAECSAIKEIHFTFKNKDDIVIIRQFENIHTIDLFDKISTNCFCDFIVFMNINNNLQIALCELKSSYCDKHLKKAIEQFKSSKLFLHYLLHSYVYYFENNDFESINLDSIIKLYYIYPKPPISNKKSTHIKNITQENIIFREIEITNKIHICSDGYEFFNKR